MKENINLKLWENGKDLRIWNIRKVAIDADEIVCLVPKDIRNTTVVLRDGREIEIRAIFELSLREWENKKKTC